MDADVTPYEPRPRWGHVSVTLGDKVYMWGGRTEDFTETQKKKLASTVEVFDCKTETWMTRNTAGIAPPGLYNSAYALHGSILYVYGGWDGQKAHNSLHKLNLKTFAWSEVKVENPDEAPPEMSGCGLVAHGNRLVLFGGYGELNEKKEKGKADERDQQHTPVEGETNATAATGQDSGSGDSNRNEGTKETDSATVEPAVNGVEEQTETGTVDTTAKGVEEQTESRSLEPAVNGVEEQTESRTVEPVVNGVEEQTESRTLEPAAVNGVEEDDWVKETLALVTIADVSGEGVGEGGMKSREGDAEKKKVAEGKEVKQPLENGRQEDDNAAVKVSNKSSEMTVEVTESVKEKSRKAVVIKLPVSYELADETGDKAVATTEDQNTNTAPKEQTNGVESVSVAEGGEVGVHVGQKEDDGEEERNTTFSIYRRNESDQKGWTNEVKVFDLDTGLWSSQPTSGTTPPPSVDFSFTCVDKTRTVVFGGYQPETGITSDTFVLDTDTWVWTKLSGLLENPLSPSQPSPSLLLHPSARDGHSACLIEGAPQPLMLVTGGWGAADRALDDMWLLDVNTGLWSQVSGGGEMGGRFWHTTVASHSSSKMRQVLTFGGCPGAPESHTSGSWPKMANTVLIELGKIPSFQQASNTGSEEKWVVVDTVPQEKLGDPMRRLRETVLLTSVRAQRAEELIQGLTKKIERIYLVQASTPKPPKVQKSSLKEVVIEEKKEEEEKPLLKEAVIEEKKEEEEKPLLKEAVIEEKKEEEEKPLLKEAVIEEKKEEEEKPFWQKSINEIQMTYEVIGRGRFSVVKVAIYHETRVAVRCLFTRIVAEEDRRVFTDCLEKAARLRHPSLVSFMGVALEREPVIITELMACNLRSLLEKNALTYYQLVDIALGVAKGLEYLHSVKPEAVVHGELTGTSVLLENDKGPRFKAKLSDYITAKYFHHVLSSMTPAQSMEDVFGASREHPSQEYKPLRRSRSRSGSPLDVSRPGRTSGQFVRKASATNPANAPLDVGTFSTKRDVYLFGILLVEMATRTAVLEVNLHYLIESIAWPQVTTLVKACLVHDPKSRPDMKSVLSEVMQLASSKP